jgi:hypothetical protein
MQIVQHNGFTIHCDFRNIPGQTESEVIIEAVQNHWGDRVDIEDCQGIWWQITALARIINLCTQHDARTTTRFAEICDPPEEGEAAI